MLLQSIEIKKPGPPISIWDGDVCLAQFARPSISLPLFASLNILVDRPCEVRGAFPDEYEIRYDPPLKPIINTAKHPLIWCEDCNKAQPLILDKMPADDLNDHATADLVCGECHSIIATLHGEKK